MGINYREARRFAGQRKYQAQMSDFEKKGLLNRLEKVNPKLWRPTYHCIDRLQEKGIEVDRQFMIDMIKDSDVVEYRIVMNERTNRIDERVILSSKSVTKRNHRVKVVYSLTSKSIITAWTNHVKDTHETLDWNLYSEDMKVFGI